MKKHKPALELVKDSMKKDLNSPLTLNNFSFKKTFIGEWKNFLFFLFLMFMTWSYFNDTAECRALIENIDDVCAEYQCLVLSSEVDLLGDDYELKEDIIFSPDG